MQSLIDDAKFRFRLRSQDLCSGAAGNAVKEAEAYLDHFRKSDATLAYQTCISILREDIWSVSPSTLLAAQTIAWLCKRINPDDESMGVLVEMLKAFNSNGSNRAITCQLELSLAASLGRGLIAHQSLQISALSTIHVINLVAQSFPIATVMTVIAMIPEAVISTSRFSQAHDNSTSQPSSAISMTVNSIITIVQHTEQVVLIADSASDIVMMQSNEEGIMVDTNIYEQLFLCITQWIDLLHSLLESRQEGRSQYRYILCRRCLGLWIRSKSFRLATRQIQLQSSADEKTKDKERDLKILSDASDCVLSLCRAAGALMAVDITDSNSSSYRSHNDTEDGAHSIAGDGSSPTDDEIPSLILPLLQNVMTSSTHAMLAVLADPIAVAEATTLINGDSDGDGEEELFVGTKLYLVLSLCIDCMKALSPYLLRVRVNSSSTDANTNTGTSSIEEHVSDDSDSQWSQLLAVMAQGSAAALEAATQQSVVIQTTGPVALPWCRYVARIARKMSEALLDFWQHYAEEIKRTDKEIESASSGKAGKEAGPRRRGSRAAKTAGIKDNSNSNNQGLSASMTSTKFRAEMWKSRKAALTSLLLPVLQPFIVTSIRASSLLLPIQPVAVFFSSNGSGVQEHLPLPASESLLSTLLPACEVAGQNDEISDYRTSLRDTLRELAGCFPEILTPMAEATALALQRYVTFTKQYQTAQDRAASNEFWGNLSPLVLTSCVPYFDSSVSAAGSGVTLNAATDRDDGMILYIATELSTEAETLLHACTAVSRPLAAKYPMTLVCSNTNQVSSINDACTLHHLLLLLCTDQVASCRPLARMGTMLVTDILLSWLQQCVPKSLLASRSKASSTGNLKRCYDNEGKEVPSPPSGSCSTSAFSNRDNFCAEVDPAEGRAQRVLLCLCLRLVTLTLFHQETAYAESPLYGAGVFVANGLFLPFRVKQDHIGAVCVTKLNSVFSSFVNGFKSHVDTSCGQPASPPIAICVRHIMPLTDVLGAQGKLTFGAWRQLIDSLMVYSSDDAHESLSVKPSLSLLGATVALILQSVDAYASKSSNSESTLLAFNDDEEASSYSGSEAESLLSRGQEDERQSPMSKKSFSLLLGGVFTILAKLGDGSQPHTAKSDCESSSHSVSFPSTRSNMIALNVMQLLVPLSIATVTTTAYRPIPIDTHELDSTLSAFLGACVTNEYAATAVEAWQWVATQIRVMATARTGNDSSNNGSCKGLLLKWLKESVSVCLSAWRASSLPSTDLAPLAACMTLLNAVVFPTISSLTKDITAATLSPVCRLISASCLLIPNQLLAAAAAARPNRDSGSGSQLSASVGVAPSLVSAVGHMLSTLVGLLSNVLIFQDHLLQSLPGSPLETAPDTINCHEVVIHSCVTSISALSAIMSAIGSWRHVIDISAMHKELLIAGSNRSVSIVHNILHLYASASDAYTSETNAAARVRQRNLQKIWASIAGSGIQALMHFWTEALKATTLFTFTVTATQATATVAVNGTDAGSGNVPHNGDDQSSLSISRSHDGLRFHSVGTDTLIAIVDATCALLTGYLEKELERPYSGRSSAQLAQTVTVEHPLAASAETARAVVSVLSILVGPVLVREDGRPNGIGFYIPLAPDGSLNAASQRTMRCLDTPQGDREWLSALQSSQRMRSISRAAVLALCGTLEPGKKTGTWIIDPVIREDMLRLLQKIFICFGASTAAAYVSMDMQWCLECRRRGRSRLQDQDRDRDRCRATEDINATLDADEEDMSAAGEEEQEEEGAAVTVWGQAEADGSQMMHSDGDDDNDTIGPTADHDSSSKLLIRGHSSSSGSGAGDAANQLAALVARMQSLAMNGDWRNFKAAAKAAAALAVGR